MLPGFKLLDKNIDELGNKAFEDDGIRLVNGFWNWRLLTDEERGNPPLVVVRTPPVEIPFMDGLAKGICRVPRLKPGDRVF